MSSFKGTKQQYWDLYCRVKNYGSALPNMQGELMAIDPWWDGKNFLILDNDVDKAYLDSFAFEMAKKYKWPDPLTGEEVDIPKKRHSLLWWLLIGWWFSILKFIWKSVK